MNVTLLRNAGLAVIAMGTLAACGTTPGERGLSGGLLGCGRWCGHRRGHGRQPADRCRHRRRRRCRSGRADRSGAALLMLGGMFNSADDLRPRIDPVAGSGRDAWQQAAAEAECPGR